MRLKGRPCSSPGRRLGSGWRPSSGSARRGRPSSWPTAQADRAGGRPPGCGRPDTKRWTAAVDVTRSAEVREAVGLAVREFGRLDVLFANAGIGYTGDLLATTDEDWDRVMDVNAKGVFLCREAVRQMLAQIAGRRGGGYQRLDLRAGRDPRAGPVRAEQGGSSRDDPATRGRVRGPGGAGELRLPGDGGHGRPAAGDADGRRTRKGSWTCWWPGTRSGGSAGPRRSPRSSPPTTPKTSVKPIDSNSS